MIERPSALLPLRRLLTVLLALLVIAPAPAAAQLVQAPQTKEEAQQAAEDARESANDARSGVGVEGILLFVGLIVLGGGALYIVRDARMNAGPSAERAAPDRPIGERDIGRGAPKGMFGSGATPDGEHGGREGRSKKRAKGKRQKQARRANRGR